MRPYMLWLARVYTGTIPAYGTSFLRWPNVLDDWLRRLREHEYRSATYPLRGPRARSDESIRAMRTSTLRGNQLLALEHNRGEQRAREAVQGER